METKNKITAETALMKYQIDFLKLEVQYSRKSLNFNNLVEHPTIRGRYTLDPKVCEFYKNFSLYMTSAKAIIKFSLPYLLFGHNYCATSIEDFWNCERFFKDNIGLDIKFAKIKELEFGAYQHIDGNSEDYIKTVLGILDYELEKSARGFKMFGDQKKNLHYKIYDAVANSKAKKTFTLGKYPDGGLLKHEIKLTNTAPYFDSIFYCDLYETLASYWDELKENLIDLQKSLVFKNRSGFVPQKSDLVNILFAGIKNFESGNTNGNAMKTLFALVDSTDLSASQKSKRRKAIKSLENQYNLHT